LVYDGLCTFEFAIAAEIFGLARPEMGAHWYRFASVAVDRGPLRAQGGLTVSASGSWALLAKADVIIVPGWRGIDSPIPQRLLTALIAAHARGARLASICSGAFVLAATGLLEGQRAATHWRYAGALQARHPNIAVDADVLYVDADGVLTSAGSAAGIDLMLHIVRADFGSQAANSVARRLVMPPHRSGGQAQYIERPVARDDTGRLAQLLDSVRQQIGEPWSVERLAAAAALSPRTLARRFVETTGVPPGEWVVQARLEAARRMLEETTASVDHIAERCGFGSVQALRHHFRANLNIAPSTYRERFAAGSPKAPIFG
jgi:AraC family transcriptional regulator, transcriptional activator FtrA